MKRFLSLLLLASASAHADHERSDYAKVTSAVPVYEQVSREVPSRHCWEETVHYESRRSTAAPLVGAIIGGLIGHHVSAHDDAPLGTFLGAGVGAAIGSHTQRERRGDHYHVEERCETTYETQWHEEIVGYDVTYRYHGRNYKTRLPYDPGKRIRINVSVTPAG
ncbi:uncharacterized protein YcfJ [Litorivivens lipolytica]|uniref:Uncharacterized protein YcfJ n=1 Tax=Litorivivens lipolytica TaxID=1524264 RepID=A0A7W4W3E2_9GAMM|nr:glycine zipper 2TM domain-containing protein [Litorivivens lipolytica]MBB3046167.1 uncharacterized protein YcfJ [Litorivivens lipolytica]